MGGYHADLDGLQRLIDTAAGVDRALADQLSELENRIAALRVHWSGPAAEAHRANHEAWAKAARGMRDAVARLRAETARAHANYHANVAHQQRMWP
jgi:WXG100 family type VII secretion target